MKLLLLYTACNVAYTHSELGKAAFLTASSCKTLASMKTNATAVVWASFGSLMVQRDRYDTYWGAKKIIILVRDIDGPAMGLEPSRAHAPSTNVYWRITI